MVRVEDLVWLLLLTFSSNHNEYFQFIGNICCTNDESNPTPVYVVQGREAVLQCGFGSSKLSWRVYNGDNVNIIASGFDVIDSSKYSVSTYWCNILDMLVPCIIVKIVKLRNESTKQ
jgi:hypothetical protein